MHYDLGRFIYRDPGHTSDWGQHPLVFDGGGPVEATVYIQPFYSFGCITYFFVVFCLI